MGVGKGTTSLAGLTQLLSIEGLVRLRDDGRLEPWLANSWRPTRNGRAVVLSLRSGVAFHDGSPVDPETIAPLVRDALHAEFGSKLDDVEYVRAGENNSIEVGFLTSSPLLRESLEGMIKKAGNPAIGTGPFAGVRNESNRLVANEKYYLGAPQLARIDFAAFPSVRSAWAELLRNRIDMLYEVGPDAIDSLETSTKIALFEFIRPYQFTIAFNTSAPALADRKLRRALNMGVDRETLVRRALNGHGMASSGPIWPRYWALTDDVPKFSYDPQHASALLNGSQPRFTCLVPPDEIYERIALEMQRQLGAINVDMEVRSATPADIAAAQKSGAFDAVLVDRVAAPGVLRLEHVWDSRGSLNPTGNGSGTIDAAFDRLRTAETESGYTAAVTGLQQAFIDDPPAIFLAWSERARAVSRRFAVPVPQQGRDILSTIRLWTPSNDQRPANRN